MRLPLIEDLTTVSVPAGSSIMVEYDPTSLWYAASMTIAGEWLRTGGLVTYHVAGQPRENVRAQLAKLGVDASQLERHNKLMIYDWYTATLGRKSEEQYVFDSLKVADQSIIWAKTEAAGLLTPDRLRILDNASCLDRFNDERAWVEFVLTRIVPRAQKFRSTFILGLLKGAHSDRAYKNLEAAHDAVVDFRLDDASDPPRNLIRIRSFRNIGFDGRWHPLKTGENSEVTLDK